MNAELRSQSRRFFREEKGTASIEFAIWVPTVAAILLLVTDLALCLFAYMQMSDVARDTARRVSVGDMTLAEGKAHVDSRLPNYGVFQVSVTEVGTSDIAVAIEGNNISPFVGTLDLLSVGKMSVTHQTRMEGGVASSSATPTT